MTVKLMNCDFADGCLELDEESIDLILTDPPYGITQNKWDSPIPFDDMWNAFLRIIKPNGIIAMTASQPFSSALVMSNPRLFRHEWIWLKNRGSNFANTVREPMKEHEHVLIFSKAKSGWTYNKQMQERTGGGLSRVKYEFNKVTQSSNYGKFTKPSSSQGKTLRVPSSWQKFNVESGMHPTQKPVTLMEYLIKTYSDVGNVVLDPFMGSGTTGVACVNLARDFIGIDSDASYFSTAKERIGVIA